MIQFGKISCKSNIVLASDLRLDWNFTFFVTCSLNLKRWKFFLRSGHFLATKHQRVWACRYQ